MKFLRSAAMPIFVYCVLALLLFGNILAPIAYVTFFAGRLGAPFWPVLVVASAAVALYCSLYFKRSVPAPQFRGSIFIAVWMLLSVALVGIYAGLLRQVKVTEFAPESYTSNSFLSSLHNAPADFQFFLHAAALKDCKPYAWSYREMAFYPLSPNVAVNVLPGKWIVDCAITRTKRNSQTPATPQQL